MTRIADTGTHTILIVDDTPANLGVVVASLENHGFQVVIAQDGEEGLQRADFARPDLILLNVMMPGLDGFEVCRRLKALAATRDIPVIFMTALTEIGDKVAGFRAGAVDYITKPLQIEEIVARVATHINQHAMQKRLEAQNAELQRYREELEQRVAERAADLGESNRLLREEIGERKRMEQALAASEREFRTLAENSPDIIARYDRECRHLYVSPAFEQLNDIPTQDLIGKTPMEFLVDIPSISAAYQGYLRAVLENGVAREFNLDWYTRHGRRLSLSFRAVPEYDRDGRVVSVLTIARDVTERQRIEAALRESEQRYRDIFNNVSDGMYMCEITEDGRFRNLAYNPAMIRLMGIPPEHVVGKFIDETVPVDAARATIAQLRRCVEAGATTYGDMEVNLPSGHRYYSSSFVPLRDRSGRIHRIVAISRDVTAQKRREMLEHTRLQMLEELADGAPLDGVLGRVAAYVESAHPDFLSSIMLVDEDGKHLRSGPAPRLPQDYLAAVDGIEIGEGIGSCGSAVWRNETVIAEDVRTHPYWASYKHLALKAGLLSCWSEPIRDSHGKVAGTFGIYRREPGHPSADEMQVVREVSHLASIAIERKRHEAVLHRREQEFRTLAENLPDMIVRYDRDFRRIYINPAYERYTGIRLEHAWNKTPDDVWKPLMPREEYKARLQRVMETGVPDQILLEWYLPDGSLTSHQMHTVAEYDEQGRAVGTLVIGHNISELKTTERRLEESRALLQELTARREEAREEERKHIAREIHDELGQLLSVLRLNALMLDYRYGDNNADLRLKTRNMTAVVDQAIDRVHNLAARLRPPVLSSGIVAALDWLAQEFARNTGIRCKLETTESDIRLDEDRGMAVFRIVQESLTNVLRHSGADRVEISLRRHEGGLIAKVRDNGRGFVPDKVPRKNSFGILGMQERVLMLEGELEITSGPGHGTELQLRIPIDGYIGDRYGR